MLQYRLNYWSRDFFDAFGRRDGDALRGQATLFLALGGMSILVAAFSVWARMTTQREWRAWLSRHLIDRWLADDRLRQLRFGNAEDPNPEFRIAEDARVATDMPVNLAVGLLTAVLNAVTFISILWSVGGDLALPVEGYSVNVPRYLVVTVTVYSALLTIVMMIVGRRMVHVIAGKNASEAQFRSVASDVRETGGRLRGSDRPGEHRRVLGAFDTVLSRWSDLCRQVMATTLVSSGNTLAAPVIAWVLCAPKYLAGTMSLGEAAQVVAAFVMVQSAMNWLVDNYPGLSECLSSVNRVAALLRALDDSDTEQAAEAEATPRIAAAG
jgi:putative ATP-binding cassette transporter